MKESTRKIHWLFAVATLGLCVVAWFYRPTNSGDWAAWVQAFGVLAAMGWGLRMQASAVRQNGRQAAQAAALFASNMHWSFRELSDACGKQAWSDFVVHRRILREVLLQGREVSLQLLDDRSLAMVSSLRAIAVEALEVTEPHSASSNWRPLSVHFDKRLPSIAAWLSATGNPAASSGPTDYAGLRTSFGQLDNP